MARLIDADALKKAIMAEPWKNEPNAVRLTVDYINIIIDEQPTVDAVPVVHGDWVDGRPYVNSRWKVCSVCHQTAPEPHGGYNYCPNCGAKMDLEVNNV